MGRPALTLRHVPRDHLIPWQWWAGETYVAGFPTRAAAERWAALTVA